MKLLLVKALLESTQQITDWSLDEPGCIYNSYQLAEQLQVVHVMHCVSLSQLLRKHIQLISCTHHSPLT